MFLTKLLVFFLLFYILVKLSARYVAPYLLVKMVKKMQKKAEKANQSYYDKLKNEGEVNIDFTSSQKSEIKPDTGEYIDYEEIKDNDKP